MDEKAELAKIVDRLKRARCKHPEHEWTEDKLSVRGTRERADGRLERFCRLCGTILASDKARVERGCRGDHLFRHDKATALTMQSVSRPGAAS